MEWGAKRIAAEFGCSRNTVKRYFGLGGWTRCRRSERAKALNGLAVWWRNGSGRIRSWPAALKRAL